MLVLGAVAVGVGVGVGVGVAVAVGVVVLVVVGVVLVASVVAEVSALLVVVWVSSPPLMAPSGVFPEPPIIMATMTPIAMSNNAARSRTSSRVRPFFSGGVGGPPF